MDAGIESLNIIPRITIERLLANCICLGLDEDHFLRMPQIGQHQL